MRRRLRLLAIGLVALVAAEPAAANGPVTEARHFVGGPFVNGEGVTWLDGTGGRSKIEYSVRTRQPGATTRRLARGSNSTGAVWLTAGDRRYLLHESLVQGGQRKIVVRSGSLTGTRELETVADCSHVANAVRLGEVTAVSGDLVADGCSPRVVRVRDFAADQVTDVPFDGPVIAIALSGRWLAALIGGAGGRVVVRDLAASAMAFSAPAPRLDESFDLNLQDDGTLAVVTAGERCGDGRAVWYSPSAPTRHELPVRPCVSDSAIAGGRLTFVGGDAHERLLQQVDLHGHVATLASLGSDGILLGRLDAANDRVAYALGTCDGGAALYNIAGEPLSAPPASERRNCPLRVRGQALKARGRQVRLRLSCPRGCHGFAQLVARSGAGPLRPFSRRPGSRTLVLRLARPAAARLRRHGHLTCHVVVTSYSRDGVRDRRIKRLTIR